MTSAQKWGTALAALAAVIVVGAAVAATFTSWNLDNSLTIALFVAVVQVASALCFMQDTRSQLEQERADARRQLEQERLEKPSSQLVEATTRRLGDLSGRAVGAAMSATIAREDPQLKLGEAKYLLGVLSAELDRLSNGIANAQQDWKFHPAAVLDVPPLPVVDPNAPEDLDTE